MSRLPAFTAAPDQIDSIVSCTIGGRQYGLAGRHIREIVRAERLQRYSRSDGAAGTVTVGGGPVPVYSPATILNGESAAAEPRPAGSHIVVTHTPGGAVGWLVDRVGRSRLPAAGRVAPLPPMVGSPATRWFEGLLRIDDRSLLMLSPEHLDPRAPAPVDSGDRVAATAPARTAPGPAGASARLVLMFASPALPRCGAERYALSARRVVAVVEALPICGVPGSAPYVIGVAAWRGEVIPVMDFRDASDRATIERSRLLVVRASGRGELVAFPVDPEMALHQATRDDREAEDAIEEMPPFVAGHFIVGGSRLALIHLDALLACAAPARAHQTDSAAP